MANLHGEACCSQFLCQRHVKDLPVGSLAYYQNSDQKKTNGSLKTLTGGMPPYVCNWGVVMVAEPKDQLRVSTKSDSALIKECLIILRSKENELVFWLPNF